MSFPLCLLWNILLKLINKLANSLSGKDLYLMYNSKIIIVGLC